MAKEVKVGLVGCGSVSQRGLLPHLVQEDLKGRCRLTAVCDNVRGRAQASARKFRVPAGRAPQAFDDYEKFLAQADVDVVALATPIGIHFEQAMAAVAAGKHVHLNKAMTTTVAEADKLIRAAKKARVKIVASPGQMLRPAHRLIKEWVEAGAIGRPYFAVNGMAFAGHEYEDFRKPGDVLTDVDPTWYYKPAGGPMLDMGVYCLHTLTGILGPAKAVMGASGIGLPKRKYKGKSITVEMDDMTILTVDFGKKGFGIVYAGFTWGSDAGQLRLHGSEGEIEIAGGNVVLTGWNKEKFAPVPAVRRPEIVTGPHAELPESHVYADILHLVDCIREGRKPEVTAEHARHVIEIMEKGYRAAKTGRRQNLTTTF
jgi:predicted dehydrogenase